MALVHTDRTDHPDNHEGHRLVEGVRTRRPIAAASPTSVSAAAALAEAVSIAADAEADIAAGAAAAAAATALRARDAAASAIAAAGVAASDTAAAMSAAASADAGLSAATAGGRWSLVAPPHPNRTDPNRTDVDLEAALEAAAAAAAALTAAVTVQNKATSLVAATVALSVTVAAAAAAVAAAAAAATVEDEVTAAATLAAAAATSRATAVEDEVTAAALGAGAVATALASRVSAARGTAAAAGNRQPVKTRGATPGPTAPAPAVEPPVRHLTSADSAPGPLDPPGFRELMRDLTAADRIESALGDSEERYQVIFDHSPVALLLATFDAGIGTVLRGNRALCQLTGYSEGALRELDPTALMSAGQEPGAWDIPVDRNGSAVDFCKVQGWTHADGHRLWVRVTLNGLRDSDGRVGFVVGCVEDITSQLRADASVRHSEESLRHSLELAGAAIAATTRARMCG